MFHPLYDITIRNSVTQEERVVEVVWDDGPLFPGIVVFKQYGAAEVFDSDWENTVDLNTGIPYSFCKETTEVTFEPKLTYPFAVKVETPNANRCIIHTCNLLIKKPVRITQATGIDDANGVITVEYTGYGANVRYSLNNVTFQGSNVFTGLLPGAYTIYIEDQDPEYPEAEWCRNRTNVVVGFPVSFGPRYQLDFDNVLDGAAKRDYSLQVYKKDYSGPVEFVCASDKPIEIEWPESGNDKYDGWKPSKCYISFYAEELYTYEELFTSDERGYRVDLLEEGALDWRGYLLPEFLSHPFQDGMYFVSLTAADGLATLKNYPYLDENDNPYEGEKSFISIIFDCLDKLELSIPLVSAIDLYADGMREATSITDTNPIISDPLFQASVNVDWFKDEKGVIWDCEKVLKTIIGTFKARISQYGGKWVIEAVDAKRNPYWVVTYNADRSLRSYSIINPVQVRKLPNTGFPQWVDEVPNHELIPAAKEIVVENDLQVIDNLIPGGGFKNRDFLNDGNLVNFHGTATIERFAVNEKENKNAVVFPNKAFNFNNANWQQSEPFFLIADPTAHLYFKIDYFHDPDNSAVAGTEVYFRLEGGGQVYTNSGWVPADATARYTINSFNGNSAASLELIIPPVPVSGNYFIRLYEVGARNMPGTSFVRYHGVLLSILPEGRKPTEFQESVITNTNRYSWTPDPYEVYFTDVPPMLNFRQTYKNYIVVNGNQTEGWHFKGETKSNNLLNIIAANIAYNYSFPTRVLRGTLQGHFRYGSILQEFAANNRLFFPDGLRIDYKMAESSGTFIELVGTVGTPGGGGGGGTPPPDPVTDTVTITNVTVVDRTITVTAQTSGTRQILYSLDGVTFYSSNVFSGVANGSYSSITAMLSGTSIRDVWPFTVVVNYVVMQPKPAAPTGWVTDDSANTGDWTDNPLFPAGEMLIAGQIRPLLSKPIINILGDHAVGTVGVRIAATATRPASDWLFNNVAYTDGGSVVIDPKDLSNYVKYIDLLGQLPTGIPDPKTAPNMPLFMQYLNSGGGGTSLVKGTIRLSFRQGGVDITVFEKGTTAAIDVRAEITPNDETNITGRRISKTGRVWEFTTGLIFTANDNVNAQTAYSAEFTGTVSGTRTASATIFPVAPSYHGVVNSLTPTENEIKGLTKQIWAKRDRLIGFNAINQRATFAEPASFGIRAIYDQNGFPEDSSFNRTQSTFTLADGTTELMNVYVKKIAAGNGSTFYYKFV